MTIEIISRSIVTKEWDRARIKLATPGSAVRLASVARHVTDSLRCPVHILIWIKFNPVNIKTLNLKSCNLLFVYNAALHPSQQYFSHVTNYNLQNVCWSVDTRDMRINWKNRLISILDIHRKISIQYISLSITQNADLDKVSIFCICFPTKHTWHVY